MNDSAGLNYNFRMISKKRKEKAGILLYRLRNGRAEIFLVHPGGPFWRGKDTAAWSIPKGEIEEEEDPLQAARREFEEETAIKLEGRFEYLGEFKQPGGKILHVWTIEGDCDPELLKSNTFMKEWPPGSGLYQEFPEVDRAAWFSTDEAGKKLHRGQISLIDKLLNKLAKGIEPE